MPRKRKRDSGLGVRHCRKAHKITEDPDRVKPFGRPKKSERPIRAPTKKKRNQVNSSAPGDGSENSNYSSESDQGENQGKEEGEIALSNYEEIEAVQIQADDDMEEKKKSFSTTLTGESR